MDGRSIKPLELKRLWQGHHHADSIKNQASQRGCTRAPWSSHSQTLGLSLPFPKHLQSLITKELKMEEKEEIEVFFSCYISLLQPEEERAQQLCRLTDLLSNPKGAMSLKNSRCPIPVIV
ncbi:Tho Complex Subunit 2 [Manis pentadactyla]|nr:Tho Complex Subunit 2 [Manis pentadactyla]